MRVLILRCGDAPLPDDLPGTVLDLPAVPGRRDLKLLDDAAANLLPKDPSPTLDEISAQPDVPHLATPGPAPQAEHLPEALRVVVVGGDAALSAVLTRMMRGDYLWAEVGFVPVGESAAARSWGLTGADAWQVALNGTVRPAPLIRSDLGIALAGSATIRAWDDGEFTGEIIVDDHVLVRHEARDGVRFDGVFGARLVPMVDAPGIAAVRATEPETVSLTWREKIARRLLGASPLDADSLATGRAVQAGGPSLAVTIDGVRHKRPLERVTFYRHLRDLQAVRP